MLLFGNHLQQDAARDVGAVLLVDDDEINSLDDQAPHIRQRYITALDSVVQPTVWVLLNHSRFAHWGCSLVGGRRGTEECRYVPIPMIFIPSIISTEDSATQREGKPR